MDHVKVIDCQKVYNGNTLLGFGLVSDKIKVEGQTYLQPWLDAQTGKAYHGILIENDKITKIEEPLGF